MRSDIAKLASSLSPAHLAEAQTAGSCLATELQRRKYDCVFSFPERNSAASCYEDYYVKTKNMTLVMKKIAHAEASTRVSNLRSAEARKIRDMLKINVDVYRDEFSNVGNLLGLMKLEWFNKCGASIGLTLTKDNNLNVTAGQLLHLFVLVHSVVHKVNFTESCFQPAFDELLKLARATTAEVLQETEGLRDLASFKDAYGPLVQVGKTVCDVMRENLLNDFKRNSRQSEESTNNEGGKKRKHHENDSDEEEEEEEEGGGDSEEEDQGSDDDDDDEEADEEAREQLEKENAEKKKEEAEKKAEKKKEEAEKEAQKKKEEEQNKNKETPKKVDKNKSKSAAAAASPPPPPAMAPAKTANKSRHSTRTPVPSEKGKRLLGDSHSTEFP